jgi:hypothetical protein
MVVVFIATPGTPRIARNIYLIAGFCFFSASILFACGSMVAASMLTSSEMDTLVIKQGEVNQNIRGVVLRRFEHSVIFLNDQRAVTILQPEQFIQVSTSIDSRRNRGALCRYVGVACPESLTKTEAAIKK